MKRTICAVTVAALALLLPTPAYADDEETPPPAELLAVRTSTANGSGCPPGTYEVEVLPDNTGFRIKYRAFRAQVGGGASPIDLRKNCQLSMHVRVPQGYTYAVVRTRSRGEGDIASGGQGLQRDTYYYAGSPVSQWRSHAFAGGFKGDWETIDNIDPAYRVWVPCREQRQLNVNTELRVKKAPGDPATVTSFMELQSMTYGIAWRRCP
jgi:Domain of unknown function (DUF4360)